MADSRLIDLSGSGSADPDAAFYFDLSRPESWLVAERIIHPLGRPAPWIPILESELAASPSQLETLSFEQVAERAAERGLLPFKPPAAAQLPNRDAMLAATYAQQAGKTVAWALAAMRQCWCAGRDMADRDTLFLAGAASEIHPNAIEKIFTLKSLNAQLDAATESASSAGVTHTPAVRIGRTVYFGDDGLDAAVKRMQA